MKLFNPFKQKPLYNTQDIHELTNDLERMSKLREKSIQAGRLYSNEKTDYQGEVARYDRDIEMAQRVLQHMLETLQPEGK